MSGSLRILVVDDHAPLRLGLRLLLQREHGMECVGEAASAEEALHAVELLCPSLVLMDLEMPGMGGLAGIVRLREHNPDLPVLVLSMHAGAEDVRSAFDAGASGYLPKTAADEDIGHVVRVVAAGNRYVHPSLTARLREPAGARLRPEATRSL